MILTINGKNYELTFGLGFLAEMNKRKPAEIEGMKTGYGAMALFNAGQLLGDPLAFYDLVKAATAEAPQKPSNEELEVYLTQLIMEGRMDAVFNDIMTEIKKSPILAYAMKIQGDQALQVAPVQTQPQLNVVDSPQSTQAVTDISTPTQTVSPY
ncbi:tail assembly chaperone [Streptococcus jiangjianxini]|uniref:tail assembly chaperone n=1 Tax=Streptococcus jiangjianxini TaxID=3161189 RepID=UPI0032ECD43E